MTREEKKEELIGLFSTGAIFIGDLIDECFEFGQHHPHWISGEDKPRENGFYLCYSDKEKAYEILSLYGADWYDAYGHYIPSCDVTHWMPLPAPPKKGGQQ